MCIKFGCVASLSLHNCSRTRGDRCWKVVHKLSTETKRFTEEEGKTYFKLEPQIIEGGNNFLVSAQQGINMTHICWYIKSDLSQIRVLTFIMCTKQNLACMLLFFFFKD